ncbi:hypothetical protein L209DRAFT_397925 [Thermothelomyces heterothallicus CBS 203.75]
MFYIRTDGLPSEPPALSESLKHQAADEASIARLVVKNRIMEARRELKRISATPGILPDPTVSRLADRTWPDASRSTPADVPQSGDFGAPRSVGANHTSRVKIEEPKAEVRDGHNEATSRLTDAEDTEHSSSDDGTGRSPDTAPRSRRRRRRSRKSKRSTGSRAQPGTAPATLQSSSQPARRPSQRNENQGQGGERRSRDTRGNAETQIAPQARRDDRAGHFRSRSRDQSHRHRQRPQVPGPEPYPDNPNLIPLPESSLRSARFRDGSTPRLGLLESSQSSSRDSRPRHSGSMRPQPGHSQSPTRRQPPRNDDSSGRN